MAMKKLFALTLLALNSSCFSEAVDYLVVFKSQNALDKVRQKVDDMGVSMVSGINVARPILLCSCDPAPCAWFKKQKKYILSVEEDITVQIEDPIEEDNPIAIQSVQSTINWGKDRLDGKVDGKYNNSAGYTGKGVDIFIIDTGTWGAHDDFQVTERKNGDSGRWVTRSRVDIGVDLTGGEEVQIFPPGNVDCNSHGTHVASIAAGRKHGIATDANIIPVKVLNCAGNGKLSNVIRGINWAVNYHPTPDYNRKKVISMSLGGGITRETSAAAIHNAVKAGIPVIVAAGNSNYDACRYDPAWVPDAICVASTNEDDERSYFSNYGKCVDLFAPGSRILAASTSGTKKTTRKSGTSMATPFVAGVIAMILEQYPSMTVKEVRNVLLDSWSQTGIIEDVGFRSPNVFLF
jgi:subtilisin family serine protease